MIRHAAVVLVIFFAGCAKEEPEKFGPGAPIAAGEVVSAVRDNGRDLSGLAVLYHRSNPHQAFADGGLNYEHIYAGHADPFNALTPRSGPFPFTPYPAGDGGILTRQAHDEPWGVSAVMTYRAVAPHYIDFEFSALIHDASKFQPHGYAGFFFASYMAFVQDVELRFRGHAAPDAPETWVASRPNGRTPGEHYIALPAKALTYDDTDSNLRINAGNEDWPRIAKPFYYGLGGGGMVYAIMFDRLWSADDEMRFTIMRWKAARGRPAWDFQYIARNLTNGKRIGFRGRLVWKPYVSPEDVEAEYASWSQALPSR